MFGTGYEASDADLERGRSLGWWTALVGAVGVVLVGVFGAAATSLTSAAIVSAYADYLFDSGAADGSVSGTTFPDFSVTFGDANGSAPTGSSIWLGATTPPGQLFGSSEGRPYLRIPVPAESNSVTITFDAATPEQTATTGWAFVLGDVDAEQVTVSASGASGALTAAQLGWQSAFNLCGVSPKPSGCPAGTPSDVPTWTPATSSLVGNVDDTDGAAGWFRPTAPITTLTLTSSRLSGIPSYQLWIAAIEDVPPATTTEVATTTTTEVAATTTTEVAATTTTEVAATTTTEVATTTTTEVAATTTTEVATTTTTPAVVVTTSPDAGVLPATGPTGNSGLVAVAVALTLSGLLLLGLRRLGASSAD